MSKKYILFLMLVLLTASGGMAQQYRINRQKLCIEGGDFVRKVPVSNESFMYIPDFRQERGETKDVTIYLQNSLPIWMFQLYLQIPEGLSVSAVDYSPNFNYWFSGDNANPNSLTWGMVGDELRIVSMNNSRVLPIPVSSSGQAVLTLRVTAATDIEFGNLTIGTNIFKFVAATTDIGYGYIGDTRDCLVNIWQSTTGISINKSSAILYLNETDTLHATIMPNDATEREIEWTSSNSNIATVDVNGVVTAHSVGTAVITATNNYTASGNPATASCTVTVRSYVEGITITPSEITLCKNATATLTVNIQPTNAYNQAVSWSSSDNSVATVDADGVVTGVAEGTAVITATTTDGTNLSNSCCVTVVPNYDVNDDGAVDISDVNAVINNMLGYSNAPTVARADFNGDGEVDIFDVNMIIGYMLGYNNLPILPKNETFTVNGVSFTMIGIEGGTFTMGATTEQGSDVGSDETPSHTVRLSNFAIGQTEVTQELWQAVMGSNPSQFTGDPRRPVEKVSWNMCQEFITKLNQMTGKNFRLPTEAEWEYAARGGNRSQGCKYAGSNIIDDVAWYSGNSGSTTYPVATKAPNELGIYDMSGNVYEWCQDRYGDYSSDAQTNPTGPTSGSYRVYRGGSWSDDARYCRVSNRSDNTPSFTIYFLGLRLAL